MIFTHGADLLFFPHSGKSSLLLALFRMLDLTTGDILIDNISLSPLRRQAICCSFVTISQEPYFLAGTIRFNIDPFRSLDSDIAVQFALRKVGLWNLIQENGGLDVPIDKTPLSKGQEQLFCLARALVRKVALGNKNHGILVLDEVTSSVDSATEETMLEVLEDEFKGWTTLSVAHRLGTIRGYDKLLVLDGGRVVEEGNPDQLIGQECGMFR